MRLLLVVAAVVFGVALLAALVAAVRADDATLPWRATADLTEVPVPLDTLVVGTLRSPIYGTGHVLTQTLVPQGPALPGSATSAWALAGLALVLIGYLTILPGLGWRAFLVGTGGLIFFLSTLNLDLLGLVPGASGHGLLGQTALVVLLLTLGGAAYALHAFWPRVGPSARLLLFAGLVGALGLLVLTRATLPAAAAAQHLVAYATSAALSVSAVFILLIAYENIRALLWLTGQAADPAQRRGLVAFAVATGLYLLNLLLLYLNTAGWVKLGGTLLDAGLVLLCSILSGLAGLRLRETEYGRAVPYLLMAPLYLLLAALTVGTFAWGLVTANDPLIEAFTDWIIITHLVSGLIFTIYVIANFAPLLQRRLRVYRVVFDPRKLPLITVYIVTVLGVGATYMRNQGFVFRLARGGYYNGLGDLARATGEPAVAERYYDAADIDVPFNLKANLSRATLARETGEHQREEALLRRALRRNPTEKTYALLAALFNGQTDFFPRQTVLRDGLQQFPASPTLNLLMGELYAHTALADSAAFYFARADKGASSLVRGALQTNRLAWELRRGRSREAAALARATRVTDAPAPQANALLAGLLTGERVLLVGSTALQTDSLTPESFSLAVAQALRQAANRPPDTTAAQLLLRWANHPANLVYAADLLETRAMLLGTGGAADRARAAMLERAEAGEGPAAARRYALLGQWALRESQPRQAAVWLTKAANRGHQEAFLDRVLAFALAGQLDSARRALPILYTSGDPGLRARARYLDSVLSAPPDLLLTDDARADGVVLRGPSLPAASADALLAGIRQPAARAVAVAAAADRALSAHDPDRAVRLLNLAPDHVPALRWLRAEAALRVGDRATTRRLLAGPTPRDPRAAAWHQYLTGALAAAEGQPADAERALASLPSRAPWLTRGILEAAAWLTRHPPAATPQAAYHALLAGVRYNPESAALWQAYALECAQQGLRDFGTDALDQLATLLTPDALATFRATYEAQLAAHHPADGF